MGRVAGFLCLGNLNTSRLNQTLELHLESVRGALCTSEREYFQFPTCGFEKLQL